MLFCYLNSSLCAMQRSSMSVLVKLPSFKDTWIFNCTEGSQLNITNVGFKINNLSKIILTDLHINNVSGLLGLLSSLNLIGRTKSLHLYGPIGLKYYLDLGKKYSRTNFNYIIYFHVLKTGLIVNHYACRIYALCNVNISSFDFVIMKSEQYGTFFLDQARKNHLAPGPLYGKLKKGINFLLPDGFFLNGSNFTSKSAIGVSLKCSNISFYTRKVFENVVNLNILLLL